MSDQYKVTLERLWELLKSKQISEVIAQALPLIKSYSQEPNLLHLTGLAYKMKGDNDTAVRYFQRSLEYEENAYVYNNLGNTYKVVNNYNKAIEAYLKAIELDSTSVDALRNLALLYYQIGSFDNAIKYLLKVIEINPNDIASLTTLGNVYKDKEDFHRAIDYYQQVLKIDSDYINAIHNLGIVYQLLNKITEAKLCFERVLEIDNNIPHAKYNLANLYLEAGYSLKAENLYLEVINSNANFQQAHSTLNEYYWQQGQKEHFGLSYEKSLRDNPSNINLRVMYSNALIASKQLEKASNVLLKGLELEEHPDLLKTYSKILNRQQEYDQSIDYLSRAYSLDPSLDTSQQLIQLYLHQARYSEANEILSKTLRMDFNNQLSWALYGTLWRLTNDERYFWLNDYDSLIKAYTINAPNGYSDLAEFLSALSSSLEPIHTYQSEPLYQTLINGTQSPGRLFHKLIPEVQTLKAIFVDIVSHYINQLPNDNYHPLLARKSKRFKFSGSWSVKLKSNGYHVNHVHPQGWISSSFYVSLPLTDNSDNSAGCIKFGETPLELGDREKIEKVIQPKEGQLVLFPSYMWHGTNSFQSTDDDFRLTTPFDVLPQ